MPGGSLSPAALATSAKTWLGQAGFDVAIKAQTDRVIIPIVHARGNNPTTQITYKVAETLAVESTRETAGSWDVWLDASSAAPIARHSKLMFASGRVLFDTGDRYPTGTRSAKPAPEANHMVAAAAATSAMDGSITWAGDTATQVTLGLVGPRVRITNKQGALATDTVTLDPDADFVWSKATEEFADSQRVRRGERREAIREDAPQPRAHVAQQPAVRHGQREPDLQRLLHGQRHPLLQRRLAVREHWSPGRRRLSRVRSLASRAIDHRRSRLVRLLALRGPRRHARRRDHE
jgi:hypothetical protein